MVRRRAAENERRETERGQTPTRGDEVVARRAERHAPRLEPADVRAAVRDRCAYEVGLDAHDFGYFGGSG